MSSLPNREILEAVEYMGFRARDFVQPTTLRQLKILVNQISHQKE
jgi:hypothetical protein